LANQLTWALNADAAQVGSASLADIRQILQLYYGGSVEKFGHSLSIMYFVAVRLLWHCLGVIPALHKLMQQNYLTGGICIE
jgi:hypothetical protein